MLGRVWDAGMPERFLELGVLLAPNLRTAARDAQRKKEIADVTMLKNNNSMVITGKGFGQTNLIAIDATGSIIEEKQVRVLPAKTVLVLQNGTSRVSYACNPECMPTVQLGDDDKNFKDAGKQISSRNGYAAGGPAQAK